MDHGEKKKNRVKTLKALCMLNYLDSLETACSGFIQLALLDSPLLRSLVKRILPTLKHHLDSQLHSTTVRDDLLRLAMSGKYPSVKTEKRYEDKEYEYNDYHETDIEHLNEIR